MRPIVLALPLILTLPAAAQTYDVVDMGVTDSYSTTCSCFFGTSSNDAGAAAGFFFGDDGNYHSFSYSGGAMVDINPQAGFTTFARGMNDAGHIVGWTDTFSVQSGFLWDGRALHDLGTLGGTWSDANDVNNLGQIAGATSTLPDDYMRAAIYQDGAWTDLGTLGGAFSDAHAINDAGTLVGWAWNGDWDAKAVYWNPDLSGPFELPHLPESEWYHFSYANGINEAGVIVGQVELDPIDLVRYRAVKWENGEVVDLGLLPEAGQGENIYGAVPHMSTIARDINEDGTIIGLSMPESNEPDRPGPWVWKNGSMTNLNDVITDTNWTITDVVSITDTGVIIGSARLPGSNQSHAVRLVPVDGVIGDINGDGLVDVTDLIGLLAQWGPCSGCAADFDGDGFVDVEDLLTLMANWG